MSTFVLTIPDALAARIEAAVVARYGWTPELGVTRNQFLKRRLRAFLLQEVGAYEVETAANAARTTRAAELETEFNLLPPDA